MLKIFNFNTKYFPTYKACRPDFIEDRTLIAFVTFFFKQKYAVAVAEIVVVVDNISCVFFFFGKRVILSAAFIK